MNGWLIALAAIIGIALVLIVLLMVDGDKE
jgi:hypothetical protein